MWETRKRSESESTNLVIIILIDLEKRSHQNRPFKDIGH